MSQEPGTVPQDPLRAQMRSKHEKTEGGDEENKHTVSSTVFESWERFKGGLRKGLPEWSAEVIFRGDRERGVLEEIGQEGSLVHASGVSANCELVVGGGEGEQVSETETEGESTLVENSNSGVPVPRPRHPLLRHTSAPNFSGANHKLGAYPKPFPQKGGDRDRRAYSLSVNSVNSVFPFPSDPVARTASPPTSMYELAEFLQQDHILPRSRNSPETWLPCPQIPRNNPMISYFDEPTPRPRIPHLMRVIEQEPPHGSLRSERRWWGYFYRGGTCTLTAQNREESTMRAPDMSLPLMEMDQWSMDVEAANTPHTPLTEKALMKHQKRLRYRAWMHQVRVKFDRGWSKFVDCFLMVACAVWWVISGCGLFD